MPDAAAIVVMIKIHLMNYYAGQYNGFALGTIVAHVINPVYVFILNLPNKVKVPNMAICVLQFSIHIKKTLDVFQDASDEQLIQIYKMIIGALGIFAVLSVFFHFYKNLENDLWINAQGDFEKYQRLTKEVMQAVESKDTFVFSLSHEIRNSLNSMSGSINYLLSVVKNTEHLKILKRAKMGGEILLSLLNNSLDAAKLKSEKMEISYSENSMEEVVKKALMINSENLTSRELTAEVFLDKSLPPLLWIDPNRVLQILMNLISNAIKFTGHGGHIGVHVEWWCSANPESGHLLSPIYDEKLTKHPRPKLDHQSTSFGGGIESPLKTSESMIFQEFSFEESKRRISRIRGSHEYKSLSGLNNSTMAGGISLERQAPMTLIEPWNIIHKERHDSNSQQRKRMGSYGLDEVGYLKVQVSDTGCGMTQQEINKLFGMFVQANQEVGQKHGGTGLGLWISKQLCQKMGGDIAVYSQVGEGTQFVFYIPVNLGQLSSHSKVQQPGRIHDKVTSLVVDDYAFNRDLHKLLLEREGVRVSMASDGKEAFEKYKLKTDDHFDFILMDVNMPEMDGFTAAKEIRKWERANGKKKADIYFVSGEYYNEDEVFSKFRNGNQHEDDLSGISCLRKPIDVQIIKRIVENYKPTIG